MLCCIVDADNREIMRECDATPPPRMMSGATIPVHSVQDPTVETEQKRRENREFPESQTSRQKEKY